MAMQREHLRMFGSLVVAALPAVLAVGAVPPASLPLPPPIPSAVGKAFLQTGNPQPYDGLLFLELFVDESRPAAPRPQELMVIPVTAAGGVFAAPLFADRRTIRRAFIPGRSTPEVDLPLPLVAGGTLGGDLLLEERRDVKVFRAVVVDARSGGPIPRARFLFDDRDHRTLAEQVLQRPEKRPGVSMHTTTDAGEIFLATDDDPFTAVRPVNISIFHPDYATLTTPARSFLREAVRNPQTAPVVLKMERGALITGRIGPRHAPRGVERTLILRKVGGGREEVPVLLDAAGNLRLVVIPGRYELSVAGGVERIEAAGGQVIRIDRD
jgi:hypothetical protein